MNILGTQFSISTHSFEIYVAGCNGQPHCKGCHNPESWDYTKGEIYDNDYFNKAIRSKVFLFQHLIQNIMIFGGEPLDRDIYEKDGLFSLLQQCQTLHKPIWLFTRYDIDEVPDDIKAICDYIKCGKYIPELRSDHHVQYGIKLATSNQKIFKKGLDY